MSAKLNKQWACVVVASLVAVAVSSGTKAGELAGCVERGVMAHASTATASASAVDNQNCTQVTVNHGGIVRLAKNAEFVVGKPYKTAKVDDPNIVDIYPISDQKVRFEAKGFGDTDVLFYDENNDLIQALHVQIEHPVAITWPGPKTVGTSSFQCWATGCEFVKQTKYEEPAKVYHNYNFNAFPPPPQGERR
jgi:Flp pilus assembly secretin CpaC